ncbi:MAG: PQQ-binding-like beta-propeller repeat protein [Planctomycetes bacterium]|nr:PQQ-binding-like beta-propeller repeat protein [Planctomycetota bacterium]MBL7039575.1 PQQ-binding-like beta-propeller repeat protein [Pirellulaceae bacterium]
MTGRTLIIKSWMLLGFLISAVSTCASTLTAAETTTRQAEEILVATGVEGGLVAHVGCGNGELTAALRTNDRYLVQGLDTSATQVEEARSHIRSLGLYGTVSINTFDGERLPYADNLVNLLVASGDCQVAREEITRALAPGGVALFLNRQSPIENRKWIKPWPQEIDEWTHFLHDASNNPVAQDTQVGPPRRLRWLCGPLWSRSHEFHSSLCAMVSAKGRLFYMFDEGLTSVTDSPIPERWMLTARDAFNGVLLWKRPIEKWGAGPWKSRALRAVPPTVPRLLVAEDDLVFMTLGYGAAVSALNAATGEILTTYEGTEGTQEIRCLGGVLLLRKGSDQILAFDTKTGARLWKATGKIQQFTLAAQNGRVFFQDGQTLLCVNAQDGKELWRADITQRVSALVVYDDRALLASGTELRAVSVDTGKSIWSVKARVPRNELFVASDQLWHWEGEQIIGRDLETGAATTKVNADEVFTQGHHLRCYQSKATEDFLITPYRGVEFVSLTGGEHTQCDWTRGPCRYGVIPSNGLLYVPPNPCFCYPGVKVTGFNAFAGEEESKSRKVEESKSDRSDRLERGPAFGSLDIGNSSLVISSDWPTYRHDGRRTGGASTEVSGDVDKLWEVKLTGRLTQPVVADGRVYVAARDAHAVHSLDAKSGEALWSYTAGGRIDSPPTIHSGMVLFGCADGGVYCLRAADGELAWRFRAAPSDQLIVAFNQLESPWRVHGSILVEDGVAYCTAGRSTYLDGGILVFGLDPKTGEVLHETRLDTWARTRKDAEGKPFIPSYHMEGTFSDILVSEGGHIYLGQYKFDRALKQQEVPYVMPGPDAESVAMGLTDLQDKPYVHSLGSMAKDEKIQHDWQWRVQKGLMEEYTQRFGGTSMGDRKMGRHVFSTAGFLDDAWFNRTFWMYSETWPGFYISHLAAKTGQLLVVDDEKTYAVQAFPRRNLQSPLFTPGEKGYLLFADDNDNEPVVPDYTRGIPKGIGFTREHPPVWHKWVPARIRAMVAAQDTLFVAGPPDVVDAEDAMASFEGRKGAVLRAFSTANGKTLAEHKLDAPPVFDGLIAASGRLFMCTTDGRVVCLGEN